MGDVEDPEIYAAVPLLAWQETEKGKWCKQHADEQMYFQIIPNYETYGYKCEIFAKFSGMNLTAYCLKYL